MIRQLESRWTDFGQNCTRGPHSSTSRVLHYLIAHFKSLHSRITNLGTVFGAHGNKTREMCGLGPTATRLESLTSMEAVFEPLLLSSFITYPSFFVIREVPLANLGQAIG